MEIRQPLIRHRRMNGYTIKVVMGDEGVSRAIFTTAALTVLRKSSPLRQLVRHVEGDHSHQKGNEKQRRYEDE